MQKKILSLLFVLAMLATVVLIVATSAAEEDTGYPDVPATRWSAESIVYMTEAGMMNDTGSGKFEPTKAVNRAMVVTVLYRMAGTPEVTGSSVFSDVGAGKWYTEAVIWGAENSVVTGFSDSTFRPLDSVTREQLVTFIGRYAELNSIDTDGADISSFTDSGKIKTYALGYFKWAVEAGLVNGVTETELRPTAGATREQFAAIMHRYDINVAEEQEEEFIPVVHILTDSAYGAVGDGVTDDSAAFLKAIASIGSDTCVLFVPNGDFLLARDVTLPENITLKFDRSAALTVKEGATLTLNCKVSAAEYRIFCGDGSIVGRSACVGYPQWFGAEGAGADDSAAVQKAVDIFDTVRLNDTATGYRFGGINVTKPTVIEGCGSVRARVNRIPGKNLFNISSSSVTVKNLYITGNGAADAESSVFYFDTAKCSMSDILISNVHGIYNGYAVKDAESGSNTVSAFRMESCTLTVNVNTTIYTTDFSDGLEFADIIANNVPNPHETSFPGWYMESVRGMYMNNVDAAGGFENGSGGDGFVFVKCSNIVIDRAMQDYVNGTGLKLIDCTSLNFSNFVCSVYEEYGIYMENVTDSTFNVIKANGIYPSVDVAETRGEGFDAVKLKGCSNVVFNNLTAQYNQEDGLALEDSTGVTVNSYVFWANNGDAYVESGSSNRNTLNGAVSCANYMSDSEFIQIGDSSELRGIVIDYQYREPLKGAGTVS